MNVPSDLKYTKSHEWIRVEGDTATIGITDHAQSELGDIVFVDMPTPGRAVKAAEILGSVESVKTVSDVYSPVSGEVSASNDALGAQSELMNADPYGSGWMVKVKIANPSELDALMDAEAYKAALS